MAGRPSLRIGQHGRITRTQLEKGMWIAKCRYRDSDGVTRLVERRSPGPDQHGKKAEDTLLAALENRQPPGAADVTIATKVTDLIQAHIDRKKEEWADRTTDTYTYTAGKLAKLIGGLRVQDATPPRVDAALRSMKTAHGASMARQSLVLFRGGLQLAVMAGVLTTNPVRDVESGRSKGGQKGATAVQSTQLPDLLAKLNASEFCLEHDLVDPITMLIGTGLRRSELLGLRWSDYNALDGSVTVTGKLIRVKGQGLKRVDQTKSKAGQRTVWLPMPVRDMLTMRKRVPFYGEQKMVFPSTAGTWRDPDNFNKDWRRARDELGFPDISSHSFRKTAATVGDEEGMTARVIADHLGHGQVSMTQNVYMARGRSHEAMADAIERAMTGQRNPP